MTMRVSVCRCLCISATWHARVHVGPKCAHQAAVHNADQQRPAPPCPLPLALSAQSCGCCPSRTMLPSLHAAEQAAAEQAAHLTHLLSPPPPHTHTTPPPGEDGVPSYREWILPAQDFHTLWECLYFDTSIKRRLLKYAASALVFADHRVNSQLISWNRWASELGAWGACWAGGVWCTRRPSPRALAAARAWCCIRPAALGHLGPAAAAALALPGRPGLATQPPAAGHADALAPPRSQGGAAAWAAWHRQDLAVQGAGAEAHDPVQGQVRRRAWEARTELLRPLPPPAPPAGAAPMLPVWLCHPAWHEQLFCPWLSLPCACGCSLRLQQRLLGQAAALPPLHCSPPPSPSPEQPQPPPTSPPPTSPTHWRACDSATGGWWTPASAAWRRVHTDNPPPPAPACPLTVHLTPGPLTCPPPPPVPAL
jgi:hypothetical protein